MLHVQRCAGRGEKQMPDLPSHFPLLALGLQEGVCSSTELWGSFRAARRWEGRLALKRSGNTMPKWKSKSIKALMERHNTYVMSFGACVLLPVPSSIGHTKARCIRRRCYVVTQLTPVKKGVLTPLYSKCKKIQQGDISLCVRPKRQCMDHPHVSALRPTSI